MEPMNATALFTGDRCEVWAATQDGDAALAALLRERGIATLDELITILVMGKEPNLSQQVVEALLNNETYFFRDRAPFDLFQKVLLPRYLAARASVRKLRVWCAASSTGQEPYSLAMILSEMGAQLAGWRIEIVATDLSTEVLEKAKAGLYSQFEVQRGLPIQMVLKYFTQSGEQWEIAPAIRSMVDYKPLNLIKDFSHLGAFDIIFCRNVLIYFDGPTKGDVFKRLAASLAPDGSVVLGAAETVIGLSDALMPHPEHRGLYVPSRAAAAPATAAPMRMAAGR
jgi:chemotaxis protein methyltransferase CheR